MSNNISNLINNGINEVKALFGRDKPSGVQLTGQQTGISAESGNVTLNNTHNAGRTHAVSNPQSSSGRITSAFSSYFQEAAANINAADSKLSEKLDKFAEDVKSAFKFLKDRWGTTAASHKNALKGFFERLGTAFKNLTGKTVSNQVSHGFREISEGNFNEGISQIRNGFQQGFEQVAQQAGNVLAGIRHNLFE